MPRCTTDQIYIHTDGIHLFGIAHFFMKANARVRYENIVFPVGRGYAGIYGKYVLLK